MLMNDARSLMVIQVLIYIICALVMLQVWNHHRLRYRGIGFWTLALGLSAVAYSLIALRDMVHDIFSILAGNAILLFAMLLLQCGFCRFFDRRPKLVLNAAVWVLATALLAFFTWTYPDLTARIVVINLSITFYFLQIFWQLLQRVLSRSKPAILILTLIVGAVVTFSSLRILTTVLVPSSGDFLHPGGFEIIYLIMSLLGINYLTMNLSLLVSSRLLEEVKIEEKKFNNIFYKAPYAAAITRAADGRVVEVNEEMLSLLGYKAEEVINETFNALSVWKTPDLRSQVLRDLRDGRPVAGVEMEFCRKDGKLVPTLFSSVQLDFDGEGHILSSMKDISEINRLKDELRTLATHDPLTGLPNRALYLENFSLLLAHAARTGEKLAVVIIDVDDFKMINDDFGHEGGDRVLIEVASRLSKSVRAGDIVARHGGDEFTLLLGSIASKAQARAALQRLKDAFAEPVPIGQAELDITISIGVALYPQDGDDLTELLRKADKALYTVKRAGKNGVSFAL